MLRIGLGNDIHKFTDGRKLVLGGIEVPHSRGLIGHSDADVVLHALCDAILGAAAMGDLGQHFPGDETNKDRASTEILHEVCRMAWDRGFRIVNADIVIMAEEPRLSDYKEGMAEKIAEVLNIDKYCVGIKATTCDGLGAVGRAEGIAATAVVLLERKHGEDHE